MSRYSLLTKEELLLVVQQRDLEIADLRQRTNLKSHLLFDGYGELLDLMPIGVELIDSDGYVVTFNRALMDMFGVKREALIGINRFEHISAEHSAAIRSGKSYQFHVYCDGIDIYDRLIDEYDPDTKCRLLSVKGIPMYDDQRKISGYLSVIEDETPAYQKETILAENMLKLKAALSTGSTVVWEYDVATDQITIPHYLNTADKDNKLLISWNNIPFHNLADYCNTIHESQRDAYIRDYLQPLLQGKIVRYNTNVLSVCCGESLWLNVNTYAYKVDEAGMPTKLIWYVTDITNQMENERIVNLFRFALSQSPNETYALDINGKIIFANPLAMERYGLTYPLEKHSFADVDPYFGLDNWQAAMKQMKVGMSQVFQTSHSLSDGTVIPLEIESYKTTDEINGDLYWSFCQDLTEQNKQLDKINSLNRLMNTILDNVPAVIHVKNVDQDFQFVYFNKEAEHFYNVCSEQMIGHTVCSLYPNCPDLIQSIQAEDAEALKQGSVSNYAVNYFKPNGDLRIVNSTRMLVESNEGKLIVTIIWDITEKRENEVELMRIRQADKMKTAFLANMSHEIRTPLNAIVGFSGIIKDVEDETERQHLVDIIEYNNELLLKLIGDILDLSKVEANEMDFDMQIVDLKDVCRRAVESNAVRIKPQLRVVFDEDQLPSVRVKTDVLRMTQILSNFITNANKFTEKGSITLGYTVDEASGMVCLAVTDTGVGISKKQQESIFDRFVKLDDTKQGTGLGLSISRVIAQKLGGEIGADSELGKGSTFWFKHPLI